MTWLPLLALFAYKPHPKWRQPPPFDFGKASQRVKTNQPSWPTSLARRGLPGPLGTLADGVFARLIIPDYESD